MVDFPSAVAPVHSSAPICLECFCLLSPNDWIQCPSCGFPLCSQECVGGTNHEKECFAFTRAGVKVDIDVTADNPAREYKCLMLLRLLMADKEELERVNLLTHHADKLTKDEEAVYRDGVIDMLQHISGNNWTTEELMRYISVIRTNAGTTSGGSGRGGKKLGNLRLLHPSLATMNHSCLCNTRVHHRADYSVCVRAQTGIKKGEEIFNKYVSLQEGRLDRQLGLRKGWHFDCDCPRCEDPTDLGAHSDTLMCRCGGLLLHQGQKWICSNCGLVSKDASEVQAIKEKVNIAALAVKTTRGLEDFLAAERRLHGDHLILRSVKTKLVRKYSREIIVSSMCGAPISKEQVGKMTSLCRNLLSCLQRIDPGLSQARIQLLQQVSVPLLLAAQQDLLNGGDTPAQILMRANEVETMLLEVLENYQVFEEADGSEVLVTKRMLDETRKLKAQVSE